MPEVGRISGPLLRENLTRDGVNLRFESNLIYLDVNSQQLPRQILTQPLQPEIKLKDALADLELAEQMSFNNS